MIILRPSQAVLRVVTRFLCQFCLRTKCFTHSWGSNPCTESSHRLELCYDMELRLEQGTWTELNHTDLTIFCQKKAAKRPKSGLKSFEIFLHLSFTYLVQRSIAFARNAYNRGINTAKRSRFSGVTTMFTVMRTLMCASIYGVLGSISSSNEDVGVHCVRSPLFTLQCYRVVHKSVLHCKMYNLESRDCTIQIVHCTQ